MPHVERPHRVRWHPGNPLPLGGRAAATLVGVLTILILLLLLVRDAEGNFVYWANTGQTSIGRAKINGTGVNSAFIGGLTDPSGVAVDSKFIYWTQGSAAASSIGRANLDGTGANPNFIPNSAGLDFSGGLGAGIAVTSTAIYWANTSTDMIGRANLDGGSPNSGFITITNSDLCGLAADQSFLYWLDQGAAAVSVGRATVDGSSSNPSFISGADPNCGIAVDPSFLYWVTKSKTIARAPVGGGAPNSNFIATPTSGPNDPCGVAVNPQYVFWSSEGPTDFIGRANLNGGSPNETLISGPSSPCLLAAAPSNKITINSITKKKKKGTAIVNAKVPGPGQVSLTNTGTQDVNATAASVKQVGLTITQASSFKLPLKPKGKTAKKLKKQVKKKGKGKVKVKAFVTFVPAGVAGVPNSQPVKTKLIKQRKRKK